MDLGFDVVVTITGIVLVFLILILLMAIITLEGKIFDSMNAKKKAAKEAAKAPAVQPAAPVQQAAAAPAPQVEEGIPGDVIAAIMAAIHAMGNGKYTLKAVRRSKNGWGNAGVRRLPRKPPRLPLYSPLHPCSRPQLLPLLRWKRAFPVM